MKRLCPGCRRSAVSLFLAVCVAGGSPPPGDAGAVEIQSPELRSRLTLKETVRLGVERNLDLLGERLARKRSRYLSAAAYRFVSPTLSLGANLDSSTADDRLPPRDVGVDYRAGVRWTAPMGTVLSAEADFDRFVSGDPRSDHSGYLTFSLRQPLLKDGWASGSGYSLELAELGRKIQDELFIGELNRLLVELHRAYWELALAEADMRIKSRSKELAKQRFEDTRENIRRGILAEIEIYVVEENLVFFTQQELSARETLQQSRRKLAELLLLDPRSPLETEDRLEGPVPGLPEVEGAVALALERNPALRAQRLRWGLAKVQRKHELNQRLPSLDLAASYKANGTAGGSDALLSEIRDGKRPGATVGLNFSIPLWLNPDRAKALSAELEQERVRVELAKQRQSVGIRVRNLLTTLETTVERLALAKRRVELGEKKLDAEGEKYKAGNSTLADVVRFQRELDQSLIGVQQEQFKLLDSRNQLLQAQGRFYESNGVTIGPE